MIFRNARIVTLDKVFNGYIEVENGIIKSINEESIEEGIDLKNNILMPGFIDIHIHGSNGIDFMDANVNDYDKISKSLYSEGVTSYLATTLTSSFESLKKVSENVNEAKKTNKSLLGIHLEGPYINNKYKGAQNDEYIRDIDISEIKELNEISGNNIKYITLAPEVNNNMNYIKDICDLNITVSCGHSDAKFSDVEKAYSLGLTNITHTFNAMSGCHHRTPGVASASMYLDLYSEMICDLIHVSSDTLKMFYKVKGSDRFMIITDSLKVKNSDIKEFDLYGLPCIIKDNAAYLKSGPLAGSTLRFIDGVKNIKKYTNASLIDLMKISSYNQSKSLKINDIGLIETNRKADFVILNDNLDIVNVFKEGELVY